MDIDSGLRRLSQSANKGRLWLGIAAAGAFMSKPTRRAVFRGLGALAVSSAAVNVALKPLFQRERPVLERTAVVRQLTHQPWTASFPSGHAASAAAFATGVALERPRLAIVIGPLAAAVAYSRVHVGVHHPSDVLAGAALGAGIAVASQRWWPVRPQAPARIRHRVDAPALPEGHGLVIAVNPASGMNSDPVGQVRRLLPAATIVELDPDSDLTEQLSSTVARTDTRAVGAAGGDGTVASVAAFARDRGLPLAVFPTGTLNHFARDVGIDTLDDARRAVESGEAVAVDVARANGVTFLNTASIGGYPEMVQRRQQLEGRFGKWLAMAIATGQVLRSHRPVRLHLNGVPTEVWMLFVGNGRYLPRGTFPAWRPRLDDGELDVQYLKVGPFSRTRATAAILAGTAPHSRVHRATTATSLTVIAESGSFEIACDGETVGSYDRCEFRKLVGPLIVYRPYDVEST
ncbi:bifunctional phosphatase PAP2/diacylglycerol kinase family protein [Phytoactinopolyspora halotolerans]|uniref:Phosphatase PAP2 family protein n=1 Tax=Phytoactinopolyspora halotolerans TaxID=1981512 RepID=A0A6L9SDF5_9ACTN|nr:phosphatase PAP2 family protein [Phytoactinopolyspora halotolerans]NEE03109.1 phosphatase PAP2 family protein [Phytoactinopolyspora halotolerans]